MNIGNVSLHVDQELTDDGRLLMFVIIPGQISITLALDREHATAIACDLVRPYLDRDEAQNRKARDGDNQTPH